MGAVHVVAIAGTAGALLGVLVKIGSWLLRDAVARRILGISRRAKQGPRS